MRSTATNHSPSHTLAGRRPSLRRDASSRGFSLIELSIVVIILGISMALVLSNLAYLIPAERIRASTRDIGNLLQFARSQAASKGVTYTIVYDLDENMFWILAPVPPSKDGRFEEPDEDGERRYKAFIRSLDAPIEFEDIQLGPSSTKEQGKVEIDIGPLGIGTQHYVHLIDTKTDEQRTLLLNGMTGYVTYHDGYEEFPRLEEDDRR